MSDASEPLPRDLAHALMQARAQTDRLFGIIAPESIYERPIAERHRLIFYLGHLEAFDWNLLARNGSGAPSFYSAFDKLFERGIDPEPGGAAEDTPRDWPARGAVETYNRRTRDWIDARLPDLDPCLVRMAIEHRHMHAETIAYMMHALDYSRKLPQPTAARPVRPHPVNPPIHVVAGSAVLGASAAGFAGDGFVWDNERAAHEIEVPPFRLSRFKVSNGEYLDFVRDGAPAPHFWVERDGTWFYRGMFAEFPLPLDSPVWVTWDEASAYAKSRGAALPTEAQFHRAAGLSLDATPADPVRDNFGYERWDPIAVDAGTGSQTHPHQMVGNGWEWTRDLFAPFAGFEPHPFYPGYSADFFDGSHYVMKGASPRTARMLTRASFRNWFRPDYPHMYAGFRLVMP